MPGTGAPKPPPGCSEHGPDADISTKRRKHRDGDDIVTEGPPCETLDAREQTCHTLQSEGGRAICARRTAIVEPLFGQTKECRGFRRFHRRGLLGAEGEWARVSTGHNLLKLFRYRRMEAMAV